MAQSALFERLQAVEEHLRQLQISEEKRHADVVSKLEEVKVVLEGVRAVVADPAPATPERNRPASASDADSESIRSHQDNPNTYGNVVRFSNNKPVADRNPFQLSVGDISMVTETDASFFSCQTEEEDLAQEIYDDHEDNKTNPTSLHNDDIDGLPNLLRGVSFGDDWESEAELTEDNDDDDNTADHERDLKAYNDNEYQKIHFEELNNIEEEIPAWDEHRHNEHLGGDEDHDPYRHTEESVKHEAPPHEEVNKTRNEPPKLDPTTLMASAFPKDTRFVYRVQTSNAATTIPTPSIPDCPTCAYHASGFSSHKDTPPSSNPQTGYTYSDSLIESAYSHACWHRKPSPFISVTNDILRAFTIAVAGNHNTVRISVIDLHALPRTHYWNLKEVLQDHTKRPMLSLMDDDAQSRVTEIFQRLDADREEIAWRARMALTEFIIWQCVPEKAVITHWDWSDIKHSRVLPVLISSAPIADSTTITTTTASTAVTYTTPSGATTTTSTASSSTATLTPNSALVSELLKHLTVKSLRDAIRMRSDSFDQAHNASITAFWLPKLAGELHISPHVNGAPLEFLLHFGVMLLAFHRGLGADEQGTRHTWPKKLPKGVFRKLVEEVEKERMVMRRNVEMNRADQPDDLVSMLEGMSLEKDRRTREEEGEKDTTATTSEQPSPAQREKDTQTQHQAISSSFTLGSASGAQSSSPPNTSMHTNPATPPRPPAGRGILDIQFPMSPPSPLSRQSYSSPPRQLSPLRAPNVGTTAIRPTPTTPLPPVPIPSMAPLGAGSEDYLSLRIFATPRSRRRNISSPPATQSASPPRFALLDPSSASPGQQTSSSGNDASMHDGNSDATPPIASSKSDTGDYLSRRRIATPRSRRPNIICPPLPTASPPPSLPPASSAPFGALAASQRSDTSGNDSSPADKSDRNSDTKVI